MRLGARILLALPAFQVVYGAFTFGMRAGLGFNTYPMMGDAWLAEAATTLAPFWLNFFENGAMIQFIHRGQRLQWRSMPWRCWTAIRVEQSDGGVGRLAGLWR